MYKSLHLIEIIFARMVVPPNLRLVILLPAVAGFLKSQPRPVGLLFGALGFRSDLLSISMDMEWKEVIRGISCGEYRPKSQSVSLPQSRLARVDKHREVRSMCTNKLAVYRG